MNNQVTWKQIYFFLPNLYIFYFLFHLNVLARTFSRMLKGSDERGHTCLTPNLSGKSSSFSPLSMKFAIGFCRCSLSSWWSSILFLVCCEIFVLFCVLLEFFKKNFLYVYSDHLIFEYWTSLARNNPTWLGYKIISIHYWIQYAGLFLDILLASLMHFFPLSLKLE